MNSMRNNPEWLFIKISLAFFWLANMFVLLAGIREIIINPVGIIKWYDFAPMFSSTGKIMVSILLVALAVAYVLEKQMLLATFLQFVFSLFIISRHESGGMFNHTTIYTVIFGVQFIAYLQSRFNVQFDLAKYRIQYSIQIIAAMYVLAGISKLSTSGWIWISSGEMFSLQVLKNYSFIYYAHGDKSALNEGARLANELLQQKNLIRLFLTASLLLELGCFIVLLNTRIRKVFAVALLLMHAGIKIIMAIPFGVIAPVMVIFFLNPLYWLYNFKK